MELAIIILTILLAVREYLSFVERREMVDRLMSRDLPEFKDNQKPEKNDFNTEDEEEVVPIFSDEAKEELVYGEKEG